MTRSEYGRDMGGCIPPLPQQDRRRHRLHPLLRMQMPFESLLLILALPRNQLIPRPHFPAGINSLRVLRPMAGLRNGRMVLVHRRERRRKLMQRPTRVVDGHHSNRKGNQGCTPLPSLRQRRTRRIRSSILHVTRKQPARRRVSHLVQLEAMSPWLGVRRLIIVARRGRIDSFANPPQRKSITMNPSVVMHVLLRLPPLASTDQAASMPTQVVRRYTFPTRALDAQQVLAIPRLLTSPFLQLHPINI